MSRRALTRMRLVAINLIVLLTLALATEALFGEWMSTFAATHRG